MRKLLLAVPFILCWCSGWSQSLSLNDYRQRVVAYNQDLKQSQQAIEGAIFAMKGVKTGFFPKVDGTGNYSYQIQNVEFMPGTDLKHDNYSVEAGLVQNIYSGGAQQKQYTIAKLQEAIARLNAENTLTNIVYTADINYWTAQANEDLFHISERFVTIVSELCDVVTLRFDQGAISKTDLLMVQNRLKEAELQRNGSYTNYKIAMQALNIMMGVPVDEHLILTDTAYVSIDTFPTLPLDSILNQRPDYAASAQNIEVANYQTKLVKSQYLPQLVAGLKQKWGTTMINLDGDGRFSTIAYGQVSIPVFHWKERRQKVRQSQTVMEQKVLEQSKLKDQINKEVSAARTNMDEALKRIEIVKSTLLIAQQNLDLNTYSYNEGRLPILDVLSAQVSWLQAYINFVSVHLQYKSAEAAYVKAIAGVLSEDWTI
ncbi:MAG: TolC family protein [Marinifilaceae bacterium]